MHGDGESGFFEITEFEAQLFTALPETYRLLKSSRLVVHPPYGE